MAGAGLITRDVRGKRTYRISVPPTESRVADNSSAMSDGSYSVDNGDDGRATTIERMAGSGEVDYDQLAQRLLRQVARNLADPSAASAGAQRRIRSLESKVTELEREVARTRAERNQVTEERDELTERLRAAEGNLSMLTDRMSPRRSGDGGRGDMGRAGSSQDLDNEERALLRRLSSA